MKLNGHRLTQFENKKLIIGLHSAITRVVSCGFKQLFDCIDLDNSNYIELRTHSQVSFTPTRTVIEKPLHPADSFTFLDAQRGVTWLVDDQFYELCKSIVEPEFMFMDVQQPGTIFMGTLKSMALCYAAGGTPRKWTGAKAVIGETLRVNSELGMIDLHVRRYVEPARNNTKKQLGC